VKPKRQRDVGRRLLTRSVVDALGHVEVTEQGDGVGPVPQILLKQLKNSTFLLSRTKAYRTKRHAPYFCFRIFHLTRMGKHNLDIAHFLNDCLERIGQYKQEKKELCFIQEASLNLDCLCMK